MRFLAVLALCSACAASLTGCTTTKQSTNLERFTLTQDVAPQVFMSKQDVNIELGNSLNEGGVMIELSDLSLRSAQNFRYINDLDKELRFLTINEYIKNGFPKNYHTSMFISKFQGTLDGQAKVWAYVEVRNQNNRLVYRDEFKRETATGQDGYEPLVLTLKNSFLEIVNEVITAVTKKK